MYADSHWDRTNELVVGSFTPAQASWLRRHLSGFASLVQWRMDQYHTDYPLGAELGLPLPTEPTEDRRLNAILDWHCCEEQSEEVRLWHEPDLFAGLYKDINLVWATLPERGGLVVLREERQIRAWFRVLLDYRITAAISWRVPDAIYDLRREQPEPGDELGRAFYLTTWLWDVAHELAETSDITVSR
ncbi:hypothetical protein JOF53_002431 [Crossiella equi]|uniref:DUF2017 domain-containing protein n=1 Tax=Crossiella equi TaxID=130796 RepID=A0ABS5ABI1_9PSEU|nr:DUF2017 family protein [Crossiella equi]MBP2473559.1 hypothetical protein [Crossiella equi]